MKTGYKQKIEKELKERGLNNGVGAVLSSGDAIMSYLTKKGYYLDQGISNPTYDYIIVGKSNFSVANLEFALLNLNPNGIIIAVVDGGTLTLTQRSN